MKTKSNKNNHFIILLFIAQIWIEAGPFVLLYRGALTTISSHRLLSHGDILGQVMSINRTGNTVCNVVFGAGKRR